VLVAALIGATVPASALACTWCSATAFGDRTFNWPYLGLILVPFAIGAVIAGVLAYHHWPVRPARSLDKETT
jgi:uncharacterized membrane protein YccC